MVGVGLFLIHQKDSRLEKLMPYLISISAGMLLALCITEFLPQSFENGGVRAAFLIIGGIWFVILAEKFITPLVGPKTSCCTPKDSPVGACISHNTACSSIGCVIICAFFDGLEIVAGFQIDHHAGLLTSAGMAFHAIPAGALVASLAVAGHLSKKISRLFVILVGLSLLLGALAGVVLLSTFDFGGNILPVVTGVLLYISVGHLLPVALNFKGGLLGLFLGMSIIILLSMGHYHH